jgi:hypothetical protein
MSVIEFGVAGGNGLVSMERIAEQIAQCFHLSISVFGFDSGTGMPPPHDYRDLAHVWQQAFYQMEPNKLRSRLRGAELILGPVSETVPAFISRTGPPPPPIGFVSFDLDYYTSTKSALGIFGGGSQSRLPRVYCYFDDIIWPEHACHSEFTGELLAIREFNQEHDHQKQGQR